MTEANQGKTTGNAPSAETNPSPVEKRDALWCPTCGRAVEDPLVCGDCATVICRVCGTPLESPDELAFG
jgi:hypothetical protein